VPLVYVEYHTWRDGITGVPIFQISLLGGVGSKIVPARTDKAIKRHVR
jgi:hypothetical protein